MSKPVRVEPGVKLRDADKMALIPVKYMGLDQGVNVTVGLPFIRTSVDHGTAFDIAGQGVADPRSLRAAYDLALDMTRNGEAV